jgi:hypothetical protein
MIVLITLCRLFIALFALYMRVSASDQGNGLAAGTPGDVAVPVWCVPLDTPDGVLPTF